MTKKERIMYHYRRLRIGAKWFHIIKDAAQIALIIALFGTGIIIPSLIFAGLLVGEYFIGFIDYKLGLSWAELTADYKQFNPTIALIKELLEEEK